MEIVELEKPFVAIWMVTYNHEPFIKKAIESVMSQKTTFPYKLYISEDNSKDKTAVICKELQQKFPGKIFLNCNKTNIGAKENGVQNYHQCFNSGAKYIALIEGDDYWTDDYKLQKQFDFLELNKATSIVGHSVKVLNEKNNSISWDVKETKMTFSDLLTKNNLFTVSIMFRNLLDKIPDHVFAVDAGDTYIKLLLLEKGSGYLMNESMAVYRQHQGGIWSSLSELTARKNYIKSLRYFLKFFPNHKNEIKKATVKYKLKHKLFFKDFSIYVFNDLIQILRFGIKRTIKTYKEKKINE